MATTEPGLPVEAAGVSMHASLACCSGSRIAAATTTLNGPTLKSSSLRAWSAECGNEGDPLLFKTLFRALISAEPASSSAESLILVQNEWAR